MGNLTGANLFHHDEGGKYPGGELNDRYFQREYYTSGALLYTPTSHWSMVYAADYIYNNLNAILPNIQALTGILYYKQQLSDIKLIT